MDAGIPFQAHTPTSILLAKDIARFEVGGQIVEAPCSISFPILRYPTIIVEVDNDRELPEASFEANVELLGQGTRFNAIGTSGMRIGFEDGPTHPLVLKPNPDVIEIGTTRPICHLSWLIYNGPWLWEGNRRGFADLTAAGWRVVLERTHAHPIWDHIQSPFHRVTHRAVLTRTDGAAFNPENALLMAMKVREFLSFTAGH